MDRSKILPVLTAFILLIVSISCASCQHSDQDILVQFMAMTNVKEGNHSHYQSISFENKNIAESFWDRWSFYDLFTNSLTTFNDLSSLQEMKFTFPFNGKMSRDVNVLFDGYLELGKKPFDNDTFNQFIAPFMYPFKRKSKRLRIFIRSTTSYFTRGISFVYKKIPDLSSLEGQNTYFIGTLANERYVHPHNETLIHQEIKLVDFYKIRNYTVIFLRPVKWCPTYPDCHSCVANNWGLPCKWCAEAQRCSDGVVDPDNVEWKTYECNVHAVNSSEQCDMQASYRKFDDL
ncbi:Hypothetical predicted protein [Cloeon dipterum]|uniref:PSI domain-containing protein n=1 Tax=Cloeon dipterum TaxID=197152 RepID=A0A8S1DPQ2_9INSE|nr:Hypothetical predicted protein [Cloeon dipterum]